MRLKFKSQGPMRHTKMGTGHTCLVDFISALVYLGKFHAPVKLRFPILQKLSKNDLRALSLKYNAFKLYRK